MSDEQARHSGAQSGAAILAVLLILLLAAALGMAQLADTLVEVRSTANDGDYRLALNAAHAVSELAAQALSRRFAADSGADWNSLLLGPDGEADPGPGWLDPVDVFRAATSSPLEVRTLSGDDGVVPDLWPGLPAAGAAPLCLDWDSAGRILARDPAQANPSATASQWIYAWTRLSDNPEPDNDRLHDTDSVVILRVAALLPSLPADTAEPGAAPNRNAVAVVEGWLARPAGGGLQLRSLREVLP